MSQSHTICVDSDAAAPVAADSPGLDPPSVGLRCARTPGLFAPVFGGLDKFSNWVILYHPHDYQSDDFVCREWKETHFLRDGDRTGLRAPGSRGNGCLRFDPGLPKIARRVVEGLAANTAYRLSAWVRQEPGATSKLAAYGYDQESPGAEGIASTDRASEWVRLTVSLHTRRCVIGVDSWAVVSLESDGRAAAYWDDVSLEPV